MNPFEEEAALLDSEPVAQTASATAGGVNPFEAEASLLDMEEQTPQADTSTPKPGGAGTPDNPFQGVIEFSQKVMQAHELGRASFRDAALGHAVMHGDLTLEEAEQQIADDDHFAQLSEDIEQYEKDSQIPWLTSMALSTAKSLPMLEESLKLGGAAGGIAGGATGLTGVGAPVAVPVGVTTGTAVAAGWSIDQITGQEYLERRRKGFSHEEAEKASRISAIIQGSLSGLQFGRIAKLPVTTAKNILSAHAMTVGNFLSEGALFLGEQIAFAEAGTVTKLATDAIAATIANKPNLVPTVEQATKEFIDTFNETLKVAIGTFGAGKIGGTVAGVTLKSVVKKAADTHLKNQEAKAQKIAEALDPDSNKPEPADSPDAAETEPSKSAALKKKRAAERAKKREEAEAEVKRIFAAAVSLFRIESDETRLQETNRIQRLLKRMVSNSDKLDDKMKVRLLKRIVEIDGEAALLKAGEKFINDVNEREQSNLMDAAHERLKKAIKGGQHKGKKAAMPAAEQQSMKWFKEFFTEPKREKGQKAEDVREAARRKAADYVAEGIETERKNLEQQLDKLEKNEVAAIFNRPAELAEKLRIARLAEQYYSGLMDHEAINKLAEEIEGTAADGKSKYLKRKEAESKRLLDNRARVLDAVQGKNPIVPSQADSAPKQMTGLGKVLNSLRRTSTSLWDKLLQDTQFDDRQKVVADILDFTEAENKEARINIDAMTKLNELYTEAAGGWKEAHKLIRKGAVNEKFEQQYTDVHGNTQTLGRASINELAYLHIAFQDPGAVPGLVNGNKFTLDGMVEAGQTSTQTLVRQILEERDPRYLAMAEAVRDQYRWFAPIVGNHYLKEYGVSLPMDANYSGQIFHRQIERMKSAADLLNDVHSMASRALDPGSTKARSNSSLPVKLVDPFAQVNRHISEMAFWVANSEKARELSFIFSDSSKDGLRDVISHKLGKEFTSLIDGRIAWQFHLKPGIIDISDSAFSSVKGNLATGMLGARPDQFFKQQTSILAALSTNNTAQFMDGLTQAVTNQKALRDYVSRSDLYKHRQDHIVQQVLDATKETSIADKLTGGYGGAKLKDAMMLFMKLGDANAAAVSGFIEYNRVLKAGGSIEEAVLAGDRLIDSTQSSSRPSQKVPVEFKKGIADFMLSFGKEPIQAFNRESGAIRDAFIHKDKAATARMMRVIAATHVAQGLFQALNTMPDFIVGTDEEKERATQRVVAGFLGGAYGTIPMLGYDVVHGAVSGFNGDQEARTIVSGFVSSSVKLLKRSASIAKKGLEGEDVEFEDFAKAFKSLAEVASGWTGIPFWGLFKYTSLGSKIVEKSQEGSSE